MRIISLACSDADQVDPWALPTIMQILHSTEGNSFIVEDEVLYISHYLREHQFIRSCRCLWYSSKQSPLAVFRKHFEMHLKYLLASIAVPLVSAIPVTSGVTFTTQWSNISTTSTSLSSSLSSTSLPIIDSSTSAAADTSSIQSVSKTSEVSSTGMIYSSLEVCVTP